MPPKDITEFLQKYATEIRGTLCVFGDWFGRPHDNWHSVIAFEFTEGHLRFSFNEGETLDVWGVCDIRKKGIQLTRQLREAAAAVDIPLLDHVIIGRRGADPLGRGYYSFREAGLL
jgi:hypothetical protein